MEEKDGPDISSRPLKPEKQADSIPKPREKAVSAKGKRDNAIQGTLKKSRLSKI
jgi:hypothetical protein